MSTWSQNKQVHKKLLENRRYKFKDGNFCFAWFKAMLAGIQGAMVASCLPKAEQTTPSFHTHLKTCYGVGYPPGETSKAGRDLSAGKVIFPIIRRTAKNCPSSSCFVFNLNQDCTLENARSTPGTCKHSYFLLHIYSRTENSTSSGHLAPKACTTTVQLQHLCSLCAVTPIQDIHLCSTFCKELG